MIMIWISFIFAAQPNTDDIHTFINILRYSKKNAKKIKINSHFHSSLFSPQKIMFYYVSLSRLHSFVLFVVSAEHLFVQFEAP